MTDTTRYIRAAQSCRRKVAGLNDDDSWRDFLHACVGKRSLREMTVRELGRVIDALHTRGAPKKSHGASPYTNDGQMRMIRGMWIEAAKTGAVHNPGERALTAFIHRMSGQDMGLLTVKAADVTINAIRAMTRRHETAQRAAATGGDAA